MAGNNAIQILRGSRDNIISKNKEGVKLKAGQLLYNKTNNYLTVGASADNDDPLTKLPIRCREIFGYTGDTESIGEDTSSSYSINYNDGVVFKSPNTFKFENTSESEKFLEISNTNGLILHKNFGLTVKNDTKNLLEAKDDTVNITEKLKVGGVTFNYDSVDKCLNFNFD